MFQKICSGITAASSFFTAAGVLYIANGLHSCNKAASEAFSDSARPSASSGAPVITEKQMDAERKEIERQLQQRFEASQRKSQQVLPTLPPGPSANGKTLEQVMAEESRKADRSSRARYPGLPGHYDSDPNRYQNPR